MSGIVITSEGIKTVTATLLKRRNCERCDKKRQCQEAEIDGATKWLCSQCREELDETTVPTEATEPVGASVDTEGEVTNTAQVQVESEAEVWDVNEWVEPAGDGYTAFGSDGAPVGSIGQFATFSAAAQAARRAHGQPEGEGEPTVTDQPDIVTATVAKANEVELAERAAEGAKPKRTAATAQTPVSAASDGKTPASREDEAQAFADEQVGVLSPSQRTIVQAAYLADPRQGKKLLKAYLAFREAEEELVNVGTDEPEAWRELARKSDAANRALYRTARTLADQAEAKLKK